MIKVFREEDFESDFLEERRKQGNQKEINDKVVNILEDIRANGDAALFKYCSVFDNAEVNKNNIMLTEEEIDDACKKVEPEFIHIIKKARENIEEFHRNQVQRSWMMTRKNGSLMGQRVIPLESVGIYVPGGTASYPSSVLMNSIPAKIAGVKRIAMATPCKGGRVNPYTVAAGAECGIREIYRIGGAQAIGAFAFGTGSVPRVNKIVGPGNIYVATAKKQVFGYVDIDMVAGPSEILIIADETANPVFLAADMMSQAEHDELASSILITDSDEVIRGVLEQLRLQSEYMDRKDVIKSSLQKYGAIIKVDSIERAIDMANSVAPEHLEIMVKDPIEKLDAIKNAGSVFLGEYSPEPLGDYFAGPNHVLPTGGTAAFFSPLSVDDFIKKSSYIYYSREGLHEVQEDIEKFTWYEGLTAHGNSIKVRF